MSVRDFSDSAGRQWRVWDVTPESIHPQTKAEDYLAECFQGGWLVFETPDGSAKRRLCPLPFGWEHRSDSDLEALMARAEVLRPRSEARAWRTQAPADLPPIVPTGSLADIPRDSAGDIDMNYLGVVRSFAYPGGRIWKASVARSMDDGPLVLRFSSGASVIDFAEWPSDWSDFTDAQLCELLRQGEPLEDRRTASPPLRRYDDPRRMEN